MPEKSTAVDELNEIKSQHSDNPDQQPAPDGGKNNRKNYFLAPFIWRTLCILLALFSGFFLILSYKHSRDLQTREQTIVQREAIYKEASAHIRLDRPFL